MELGHCRSNIEKYALSIPIHWLADQGCFYSNLCLLSKTYKKHYYLLRSDPGIGPITAANIISELGDLRRFQSLKKLAGYIGIAPGMYCSGDNEKFTGATPRAHRTIRSLIVEASWVAIRQDPVLQQYYRKHAGKDSKAAIFKVSRKLLSRIHAVIKSEITYEIGIVQ